MTPVTILLFVLLQGGGLLLPPGEEEVLVPTLAPTSQPSAVPAPPNASGYLAYSDPLIVRKVMRNRLGWGQVEECPECIGYLAVEDPKQIGDWAWVVAYPDVNQDGVRERVELGPLLIYDCVGVVDRQAMRDFRRIGDIDWHLAGELGMIRRGTIPAELYVVEAGSTTSPVQVD